MTRMHPGSKDPVEIVCNGVFGGAAVTWGERGREVQCKVWKETCQAKVRQDVVPA